MGWGQVLVGKWPPGVPMLMSTPQNYCCQCFCLHSEPQPHHTSARDPPILAGRSGPVSYEVTAFFSWVLVCTRPCVCPPRVEFLFLPVLWNSCDHTLLAFKARFSGGSSSNCQTHRLGILTWDSGLSRLWQNFCGVIIFQFVGCPPSEYGI